MADDVVRILREELADLAAAGADFVQFDEPVLTEVVMPEEGDAGPSCERPWRPAVTRVTNSPTPPTS